MNRLLLFVGIALASALVAHADEDAPPKKSPETSVQGLTGKVLQLTGDRMPSTTPTPLACTPLAVPVHIFRGEVTRFEKPDPKNPALVQIVQSDKEGIYKLALPPGKYTAAVEINGRLSVIGYNSPIDKSAPQPTWSTVEVKAGTWTTWDIVDMSHVTD